MGTSEKSYRVWPQIYASLSVSLSGICTGTFFAFGSVAVPMIQMPEDDGGWNITMEQGSWIVSLLFIGTLVGSLLGGSILDFLGARRFCLIVAPTIIVSWLMIAFAPVIEVIYAARIIQGICYGFYLATVKVYNAEVSHPDLRGAICSFYPVLLSFGLLYTFLIGYLLTNWRYISLLLGVPSVAFLLLSLFIPDSPFWLVERNQEDLALKNLQWLRGGKGVDVSREMRRMSEKKKQKVIQQEKQQELTSSQGGFFLSFFRTLLSSNFLRPFLRVGTLMVLIECGGMNTLSQYMVYVFQESMPSSFISPTLAPVAVAGLRFCMGIVATGVLRYSPRKPLFLTSAVLVAILYSALGGYIWMRSTYGESESELSLNATTPMPLMTETNGTLSSDVETDTESYYHLITHTFSWVPLLCLMIILTLEPIGFIAIIHLNLQAESFPTEIRSLGCGLCGLSEAVIRFCMTKVFPSLVTLLGLAKLFWLLSLILVVVFIYGIIVVPENKGQSLVHTESKYEKQQQQEKKQQQQQQEKEAPTDAAEIEV